MNETRKRSQCHKKLTDYLTKVDAHYANPTDAAVQIDRATAVEYIKRVEELFRSFEAVQDVLEATAADDAALQVQSEAGAAVEETFTQVRGKLRALTESLSTGAGAAGSSSSSSTKIKLPPMPLATFEGKYENWVSFYDRFTGQIAGKSELSAAQKLQYLKSSLKGKPEELIDDLPTTDANYAEAWKILKERYDNKREIIRAHVKKLLHHKTLKVENATELQSLCDSYVKNVRALATQGCPTDRWDDLIVVMLEEKLDSSTRREWAKRQTSTTTPPFSDLVEFMKGQVRGLQAANLGGSAQSGERRGEKQVRVHHAAAEEGKCPTCQGPHGVQECKEFLNKLPSERSTLVKNARLCFNCLRGDHMIRSCPSNRKCKKCGSKHHTLLHEERPNQRPASKPQTEVGNLVTADSRGVVMTVMLHVPDKHGVRQPCRAFLDPGATADFISEACTNRLGLERGSGRVQVKGFGDTKVGTSKGIVRTTLYSRTKDDKSVEVELHIMDRLTGNLPTVKCKWGKYIHLQGLQLADPRWHQPGPIDIVLGIKYYSQVMLTQRIVGPTDSDPIAWESIFGWIVAGACPVDEGVPITSFHIDADPIMDQLRKFWEVEEPPKVRILTQEEKRCEEHFKKTYSRDLQGRFTVGVPFDEAKRKTLGRSRDIAERRWLAVERRLKKSPAHRDQYVTFMKEYEELGHMRKLAADEIGEVVGKTNYLCHHFVTNESSSTTKLRVVFDGSAATSSGVSLNATMLVGATLQDDIYDLLLRFRVHAVVLKADIAKMFRQFRLREDDAKFHRILWREQPDQPLQEYQLETITYGTACAPNLSTRCIMQLGLDCSGSFPDASRVLLNDTYVDDILSGKSTPEDAVALFHELNEATSSAGLELRKWTSNSQQIMESIPEALRETSQMVFDDDEMVKALGVQWHPQSDRFRFKDVKFEKSERTTKRLLLSHLASIFDPLGLISCVTLRGKQHLQELWKLPVGWDDEVPASVQDRWVELQQDLKKLPELTIPRRITFCGAERLELHSFSDASELGLGGILYLRSVFPNGSVEVRFITSKTRVAPLKQVTLPRLELCAAVLVAELAAHVQECLKLDVQLHLWTDSTITLTWIQSPPRRWKTYIANRVAAVQKVSQTSNWRHVAGMENPADLASRGCAVEELLESRFWWEGPHWLSQPELPVFPQDAIAHSDMEERKDVVEVNFAAIEEHPVLQRCSSFAKLRRLTAWYLRYIGWKIGGECVGGPLMAHELHQALMVWIRKTQQQYFSNELSRLKKGLEIPNNSKLRSLHPFIDKIGILRVSGRLQNAEIPEERKHQIILPGESRLSHLIITEYHHRNFHSGFQLTWATIQQEYWILRGRDKTRHFIRSCVRCRRHREQVAEQLMGDLPGPRVQPSRPFLHAGVDYAGPFQLKDVVGKVPKVYKGYMSLFVCMVTKAIHLEAVSSLSTEAFLAALRRFVARRGLCAHIYSDCGTNFVGADRELKKIMMSKPTQEVISKELSDRGITWHFNPPASPHRGGLWEAGVKAAKHHLRRVIGNSPLTFEQFATVLTQIEAVLNSRPLYPMSADPDDLQVLTPGHFLIGAPLITVPDSSWLQIPRNRLSQFQRLQQQLQHFWQRWSLEYLNTLQQRNKWMWAQQNVGVGDLVLLVEETAPGTWRMGRVMEVHPGADGKVRMATIKTATATTQRVIAKLVPLLRDDNQ